MSTYLFYAVTFIASRFGRGLVFFSSLFLSLTFGPSLAHSQCPPLTPGAPSGFMVTSVSTIVPTPTVTPNVNASGLIAYWNFDEGAGTTACDSSGNGNTATLINGPLWTTGRVGKALYFDGINANATVPGSNSLNLSNSFTLSAWVNPASTFTDFRSILVKNYKYYLYASAAD